ncbi:hypothetical protein TNCV_1311701 [Trichonephila clavipes]|nr:hypothetical protein TNCV_1311701 [Trichonephila clavipes]
MLEEWVISADEPISRNRGESECPFFLGSRPSGIVAGDADCCAVGPGFESPKRHGSGQWYQTNGLQCDAMAVLPCPKPITQTITVPRLKHNIAFVRFTRVNNQGERNNIQRNAQICRSKGLEQNNRR